VAAFVALTGMVEAFSGRRIVEGAMALGLMLPLLCAFGAGYQATARPLAGAWPSRWARGLMAGLLTGTVVSAVVLLGATVNLRRTFVAASPLLFRLLSFEMGAEGFYVPALAGAGAGLVGGALALLAPAVRRPVVAGLLAIVFVGLFQEMLQTMLADRPVVETLRAVIFAVDALSAVGTAVVFVAAALATAAWATWGPATRRRVAALPVGPARLLRALSAAALVGLVVMLPVAAGPFLSHVLVLVGLYVLMGLGLNLEVGFAGLLDLGFVAFFAIGAYTIGLLTATGGLAVVNLSFWTAVPIAVAISLAAGILLGVPVLRIRGDYLAIATLGFGEIIRLLVLSDFLRPWLGGSQGVLGIPKPVFFGIELATPEHLFYLTIAASGLVAFVATRLRDSRLGRAWMALREDEDVAEAMGIDLVQVKLLAYGLGAAFAGVSGAIFGVMVGSVFPHSFQLLISINVLALIIVGGMGSMPGVVLGALFLVGLPELLREFADFRFLVYGAALVLMMQLRPEGLWPAAAIRRELHAPEELDPARRDI
jgi:branched-chain amino acid transport system permease protein